MDVHENGRGRIIFLGDGKEILADGDDEDEDRDIEMHGDDNEAGADDKRRDREETPGPESHTPSTHPNHTPMETDDDEKTSSTSNSKKNLEAADLKLPPNAIPQTAIPDKLVTPTDPESK